ncbi:MAG: hypothetical protein IJI83_05315 [Oscillospiraceae bacterium]|nr:hypothetical protein [Oscillospiraceae bacterium]
MIEEFINWLTDEIEGMRPVRDEEPMFIQGKLSEAIRIRAKLLQMIKEKEIRKAEATTSIASAMLKNASLALAAQKQFDEYGTGRTVDIPLLGISNEDLMHKNKVLRMQLADKEAMQ